MPRATRSSIEGNSAWPGRRSNLSSTIKGVALKSFIASTGRNRPSRNTRKADCAWGCALYFKANTAAKEELTATNTPLLMVRPSVT